jgi:hypothetical protein
MKAGISGRRGLGLCVSDLTDEKTRDFDEERSPNPFAPVNEKPDADLAAGWGSASAFFWAGAKKTFRRRPRIRPSSWPFRSGYRRDLS